ncbi:8-amino-7-oxononanoate synthase [Verrucomicrobia bacterium]|nr:8-amino-7-oxononanoate synthase [Verrucomicrobiota bacterium]
MSSDPDNNLDSMLSAELDQLSEASLLRSLRTLESPQGARVQIEGRELINFSSNDYLGLADSAELKGAAIEAIEKYGVGSGASRLICGGMSPHVELEDALADWKGTEAALSFSSGFAAAIGTIPNVVGSGDIVIIDKLLHACLIDAARQSGATLRVFSHNDLNQLESHLQWAEKKRSESSHPIRVLVVIETVYSMDGDLAPLLNLVDLKERYGAWLMVDEAHATGMFGETRSGLVEEFGVRGRVEIQMGTLGKAMGVSGGYICGSRNLIDLLINRARSFVFSTAPLPSTAATAVESVRLVRGKLGGERRSKLWAMVDEIKNVLIRVEQSVGTVRSPIIPLMIGDEQAAMDRAVELLEKGLLIPAIRYPTVARGKARLRLSVSAAHGFEESQALEAALTREPEEID